MLLYEDLDREQLDQIVQDKLSEPELIYGEDYVGYDETAPTVESTIKADLDLMLLELDEEEENPFDEDEEDDDSLDDEYTDGEEKDDYEFYDFDPEIFRDPALMVKWLNHQDSARDN